MKRKSVLALVTLITLGIVSGCSGDNTANTAKAETEKSDVLSIPLDSLSGEPLFVDWEQDGLPMQLIALTDEDGARVAYNTCQSCAGSPKAYFEYEDGILTCQNCGFTFGLDSIGAVSGGCNPKPVGEYTIENGSLVIGREELESAVPDFETWKKF